MNSSSGSSDVSRRLAVAAAVAVGAVGVGAGLYYLSKKKPTVADKKKEAAAKSLEQESTPSKLSRMTALELKELGNKLFSVKKYERAIEIFTHAIEKCGPGDEELAAACFQNRAASREFLPNASLEEIIADCQMAINNRPGYGKAYMRKARQYEKQGKNRDALIELFTATHVEPSLDSNIGEMLGRIAGVVAEEEKKLWIEENQPKNQLTPVRHEKVYAWLRKFGEHDPVRCDIVNGVVADGPYYDALKLIRDRKYDDVVDTLTPVDESEVTLADYLKVLLLLARFQYWQNRRSLADDSLIKFEEKFATLAEVDKEMFGDYMKARLCLSIEIARDKDELKPLFEKAIGIDKEYIDFYTTAVIRYTQMNEIEAANEVSSSEGIVPTTNLSLAKLMVGILLGVKNQDMSLAMDSPTPYALSLLSKVYTLFQSPADALENINKVLEMEPNESAHYFESSLMSSSEDEMWTRLNRCIELEPHHAEANLMLASLRVNKGGAAAISLEDYNFCCACLDRAMKVFVPDSVDFPVVDSVFQMMAVLKTKREAGVRLGVE
ncbi:unnamed protein product, partial [Mesorhabditis spiculigera]